MKTLRPYETLFIINPNLSEDDNNSIIDKFKSIIEKDGEIVDVDKWGKRKLAYEINDLKEGYYVLINFNSDTDVVDELQRVFKIDDEIMRYIVVRRQEEK